MQTDHVGVPLKIAEFRNAPWTACHVRMQLLVARLSVVFVRVVQVMCAKALNSATGHLTTAALVPISCVLTLFSSSLRTQFYQVFAISHLDFCHALAS